MTFDSFIDAAWRDHGDDARAVAKRLGDGIAMLGDESQMVKLAAIAHHVYGEHLGEWRAGIAFVEYLAKLPMYDVRGESGHALRRFASSLALSENEGSEFGELIDSLTPSDRIRVSAMAASNLSQRDTPRATRLLEQALDDARRAKLDSTDPMNRALAVAGNNVACTLEEKTERSSAERDLMILAAQAARHYWQLAGTWVETERAEYRLAMSWIKAGEPDRAREHAQWCIDIVAANDGDATERFFGWEALAQVERAAGDPEGFSQALTHAREAFAALPESDKAWCAESLDKLQA